jgi:hypothetical protein
VVSIFAGLGAHFLQRRINRQVFVCLVLILSLLPVPVYAVVPAVAEKVSFNLGTKRDLPYRNGYSYFLRPWKTGYRGTERFANEALDTVEDRAVIYADGTTVYSLLYVQEVVGGGEDVTVVSGHGSVDNLKEYSEEKIDELFAERAIYVVSPVRGYCPGFLLKNYDFVKSGVLWRVVGRAGTMENK